MAIPLLANVTKNSTNGTATIVTLTKPNNVVTGDLLIILCGNENATTGEGFADTLTGWTREFNLGSGDVDCYIGLYSRIADGTETTTIDVPMLGADDGHGWYMHFQGAKSIGSIHVIGTSTEVVSNIVTVGSITTTEPECLAVSTFAFDGSDSDPITETGTGWTMQDWTESPLPSDAGGASSGAWSTKDMLSAGPTGDSVWNMGGGQSDGIVAVQFAILGGGPLRFSGSADITSSGATSTEGIKTLVSQSNILGVSIVNTAGIKTLVSQSNILGAGIVNTAGIKTLVSQSNITSIGSVNVTGIYKATTQSNILSSSSINVTGIYKATTQLNISGISIVNTVGIKSLVGSSNINTVTDVNVFGFKTLIGSTLNIICSSVVKLQVSGNTIMLMMGSL